VTEILGRVALEEPVARGATTSSEDNDPNCGITDSENDYPHPISGAKALPQAFALEQT